MGVGVGHFLPQESCDLAFHQRCLLAKCKKKPESPLIMVHSCLPLPRAEGRSGEASERCPAPTANFSKRGLTAADKKGLLSNLITSNEGQQRRGSKAPMLRVSTRHNSFILGTELPSSLAKKENLKQIYLNGLSWMLLQFSCRS